MSKSKPIFVYNNVLIRSRTDARQRGQLTSDVYVVSALIEHHVYKDVAGTKIFERGAKLFPEDEVFILEYLKHLMSTGDTTSTRFLGVSNTAKC